ncbi:MAG: hypothetical protein HIU81_09625 [Acidobacteria bacterium]|nr:hypothetical protein [Acidobacteriota bacterium]
MSSISGDSHALTSHGTGWGWGNNVGDNGASKYTDVPLRVPGLSGINSIAANNNMYGSNSTDYAVKSDGTV